MNPSQELSLRTEPQIPELTLLLEQRKVVRILQPGVRHQVEESLRLDPSLWNYVTQYQGEMYLSLENVSNAQRRAQIYDLVQAYQIDPTAVDLQRVPKELRACLQPGKTRQGRLIGAVAFGVVAGVLFGLMGMAVGVLVTAVLGLADENVVMTVTGMTFVTCCALGWATAAYYLWHTHPLGFWRGLGFFHSASRK